MTDDEPTASARLAGLLTLALVVGTVNGLSRVSLPLYAASLGAQAWQVGLVGGLGYFGVMLLSLPVGAWIDRHGGRALFTRGVLAAALLMLLIPRLTQPWMAVLGTALLGLVLPFRTVPAQTEFLALLPQLSTAKAGWNRAAHTTGLFFLGPAVAAALIAGLGFPSVFELASAGLLLGFLIGRRVLSGPTGSADTSAAETLGQRLRAQFTLVAGHAELRRTMLVDACTQMAVAYFVVFTLVLALRRYGMPLQAAAGLITLQGTVFVATLLLGGRWLTRRTQDRQYLLAFVLVLAQTLLFGLGSSPTALWLGAALMGLGVGLQGLTSTSRFAELMQEHGRGRLGGLTSMAPTAGGMVGAIGGGLLSQQLGIEAGFRVLAVLFGLLCLLQLRRLWLNRPQAL